MRLLGLVLVALAFAMALTLSGCGSKPAVQGDGKREAEQVKADATHRCGRPDCVGEKGSGEQKSKAPRPARGSG
ncbi:MAG: hypothetical protein ACYS9X_23200 [Planctomycetota bacterium]|jgi:uncharacterized membrane protein